jgi:hypothetical protein
MDCFGTRNVISQCTYMYVEFQYRQFYKGNPDSEKSTSNIPLRGLFLGVIHFWGPCTSVIFSLFLLLLYPQM